MTLQPRLILAVLLGATAPSLVGAQVDTGGARRLHIGSAHRDTTPARTIPDSVLNTAVTSFNRPGAIKLYGDATFPAGTHLTGPLLGNGGRIRLDGQVDGDVVIINGDLLVASTGRITGALTLLGGRLIVEDGAEIGGKRIWYQEVAPVARTADNTLVIRARSRSLAELASSNVSIQLGPVVATLDAGFGTYNRVEGLPLRITPRFAWQRDEHTTVKLDFAGILRTSSDPSGTRPALGWSGQLSTTRTGVKVPLTVGFAARQLVAPMASQTFTPLESAISTLVFHEDFRDWYARRGWGLFADWKPSKQLTVHGTFDNDRERSEHAADPFSVLRNDEAWRPNPLTDDGKFRRLALGVEMDTRDDSLRTSAGWWLRATLRRVTSSDLSPLSLPTSIRSQLPFTDYASDAVELDVRRYLQLGPTASLHLRFLARGWLGGDPLLTQDRLSMGGGDVLPGYLFRDGNCERRRTPDPANPALCDRQMAIQAEYHRELNVNLSMRVGRYTLGLNHPALVLFGNTGSAWLSGDSAGRVPNHRIQKISEWQSDVGVGLDNRWVALYLAKSLVGAGPVRLTLRLRPRF